MATELPTPNPTTVVADDPSKPRKAIVAGIIGALVAGLAALLPALGDGTVTPVEWVTVALAVLVAAGGTFGGTYFTTNPKVVSGG